MKIIVNINASMKKGHLPSFTRDLYSFGCELQKILRSGTDGEFDIFDMELIYTDNEKYRQLLEKIEEEKTLVKINSITNLLEDSITGGLLRVAGKMAIENQSDYDMKVLGSATLLLEKIAAGESDKYSGVANNIGMLYALRRRVDLPRESISLRYVHAEKDSIILHKFAGYNGFPVIIKFHQTEDLVKTIQGIESTFSAIRILDIEEVDDISTYEHLCSEISVPVVSLLYDEIPLSVLIGIFRLLGKNGISLHDTTIGIVGINISVLRLTRLLHRLGCPRVLGYDNNEKLMLSFEKSGGLATTPENIFSNSDLMLLVKNHFTIDELNRIRSGQMIISMIDEEDPEKTIISEREVREYVSRECIDTTVLFPGILDGMIKSGKKGLGDDTIIELSKQIQKLYGDENTGLSLFSDVHDKIAGFL